MIAARRARRTSATTAALIVWLCIFFGVSHGLHSAMPEMDTDASLGVMAICLVLFTVAAPLGLAAAAGRLLQVEPATSTVAGSIPTTPMSLAIRARASPDWLQRFRN